jgi:hypothetical protein
LIESGPSRHRNLRWWCSREHLHPRTVNTLEVRGARIANLARPGDEHRVRGTPRIPLEPGGRGHNRVQRVTKFEIAGADSSRGGIEVFRSDERLRCGGRSCCQASQQPQAGQGSKPTSM